MMAVNDLKQKGGVYLALNKEAFGVFKEICKMSCKDSRCFAFTRHEVMNTLKMDNEDVNQAFDLLIDESYLRTIPMKIKNSGKSEPYYEISPQGFEFF